MSLFATTQDNYEAQVALLISKDPEGVTQGQDVGRTHGMGNVIYKGRVVADWRWTKDHNCRRMWTYRVDTDALAGIVQPTAP